ncbi:MAG: glutathione S-transferase N-terminal domain-containing protein [Alphaproteobacteria bacterium]
MIDLYYWPTPNGHKVSIMLEEVGLDYQVHPVNILKGDQFDPDFLKISPNNRIPAIVDQDGPDGAPYALFESGAILIYLAEKTGILWPQEPTERYDVLQWLFFQNANVGPMFGQCGHFQGYAPEPVPYAIERYHNETLRLYGVMDKRLGARAYLAGDVYSLADVATYPWCMPVIRDLHKVDVAQFPNVNRWLDDIAGRPAVHRGTSLLADVMKIGDPDDETREAFFGTQQLERR